VEGNKSGDALEREQRLLLPAYPWRQGNIPHGMANVGTTFYLNPLPDSFAGRHDVPARFFREATFSTSQSSKVDDGGD